MIFTFMIIFYLFLELIFYTFLLTLLILLIAKRKDSFKGAFFSIFRISICGDLASFIGLVILKKVTMISFLTPFFQEFDGFLSFLLSQIVLYAAIIQFLGHLLMAFNRFTLIWFPIKHQAIWKRQWYTVVLLGFAIPIIFWKIFVPTKFAFSLTDYTAVISSDPVLLYIYYVLTTTIFFVTTCISAILNILSFFKFYFYKQSSNNINVNEKSLLFVSFIVFVAQLFRTSFNVSNFLFSKNVAITTFYNAIIDILYDIFALSGSVSLFALSAFTRKEYMAFYFGKKTNIVISSSHPSVFNANTTLPQTNLHK